MRYTKNIVKSIDAYENVRKILTKLIKNTHDDAKKEIYRYLRDNVIDDELNRLEC